MFKRSPIALSRSIRMFAVNHIHIKDITNVIREITIGLLGKVFSFVTRNKMMHKREQIARVTPRRYKSFLKYCTTININVI